MAGLGESTHGTREFFTLKHRLLEFLTDRMNLRVFAMEASESAALAVDDYVTTGRGSGPEVLAGLGFWTWRTREMLAVLEWLRAHNATVPVARRVRFVGVDPQRPESAVDDVQDFLRRRSPGSLAEFSAVLSTLREPRIPTSPPMSAEELAVVAVLEERVIGLAGERDGGVRALRQVRHLRRSAELAGARADAGPDLTYFAVRDRLMADAVADIVSDLAPAPGSTDGADGACSGGPTSGVSVALWAHNGHLSTGSAGGVRPMGAHLRDRFGAAYYPMAFLQGRGSFRARRRSLLGRPSTEPMALCLPRPPAHTVDGLLARAGDVDRLIDLRGRPGSETVERWRSATSWTRSHGAVVPRLHRYALTPVRPGVEFDGLAFVARGGPSTLMRLDGVRSGTVHRGPGAGT